MTLYPDVQRRAQQEIDSVIGRDRLPSLADRENLPYVEAVVNEVLRINPVAPLGRTLNELYVSSSSLAYTLCLSGVPHRAKQDDVYNGYFIPEGTVVIANIWSVLLFISRSMICSCFYVGPFCMTPRHIQIRRHSILTDT